MYTIYIFSMITIFFDDMLGTENICIPWAHRRSSSRGLGSSWRPSCAHSWRWWWPSSQCYIITMVYNPIIWSIYHLETIVNIGLINQLTHVCFTVRWFFARFTPMHWMLLSALRMKNLWENHRLQWEFIIIKHRHMNQQSSFNMLEY